jgi:hypothetical protein
MGSLQIIKSIGNSTTFWNYIIPLQVEINPAGEVVAAGDKKGNPIFR